MKKILPLLAVLSLATACIYPYQPDLEEAPEGVLVVDGNLVLGEMSTVYVGSMSSLWPGPDDARPKIPVKRVWAEDDAGGVYEGTISSDGQTDAHIPMTKYVLHTENAPVGHNYRVCVNTDDALYTSDWIKPLTPPVIKKINFRANLNDVMVNVTLDGANVQVGLAQTAAMYANDETLFGQFYRIKPALLHNATAVILLHNHPSGNPLPSFKDMEFTKRLKNACSLFEIDLIDHIIIGKDGFFSFADEQTLKY